MSESKMTPDTTDKGKREAFEAWADRNGFGLDRSKTGKSYRLSTTDVAWDAWRAALAARPAVPQPPVVLAGWKLVPETPTQEMCQQGQWKAKEWPKFPLRISPIYQAMLDAAPSPEPAPAVAQGLSEEQRDAERYRWLRDHFEDVYALNDDGDLVVAVKSLYNSEASERLDAAIDAAQETQR